MKLSKDLKYPVFMFKKDSLVQCAKNPDQLGTCNSRALNNHYFDGVIVITIEGEKLIVTSAKQVGVLKPWWTSPLFLVLLKAELEMAEAGVVSIDEVKSILLKSFRKEPLSFYGFDTITELKQAIDKCSSFAELVECIHGT